MLTISPLVLVASAIVVAIVSVNRRRKWAHRLHGHRLPPGPRGWPIIGSLFDLPDCERPWTVYRQWAQTYGKPHFSLPIVRDSNNVATAY